MSAQLQSPDTAPPTSRRYTYDHIPLLRELLPKQHGRPGFTYAQVAVINLRRAEDQGWDKVADTVAYTIIGPKGQVDVVLMARGRPLRGIGHASGKRRCVVDLAIEESTGLPVRSTPLNTGAQSNGVKINEPQERRNAETLQRGSQTKAG